MTISVWEERYRPKRISELILPDRLKVLLQKQVDSGDVQNMLLEGGPGCGKTTAALALCSEIGCDWIKINGSENSGIDVLRGKVRTFASTVSLFSEAKHKMVIFDESDYIPAVSTQPALRGFIDEFKETCRFVFTCNYKSRIIQPLHSRLDSLSFNFTAEESQKMAAQFMERCEEILTENGVVYEKPVLAQVIKRSFPDFRKILVNLQKYSTIGSIDSGILLVNAAGKIESLVGMMKSKDFPAIRKFFAENPDVTPAEFFDNIYAVLRKSLEPASIPQAVLTLSDYMHKSSSAISHEINFTACCVQLMMDCKFR